MMTTADLTALFTVTTHPIQAPGIGMYGQLNSYGPARREVETWGRLLPKEWQPPVGPFGEREYGIPPLHESNFLSCKMEKPINPNWAGQTHGFWNHIKGRV